MSVKLKLILYYFTLIALIIILIFILGVFSGNFLQKYKKLSSSPQDLYNYLSEIRNNLETNSHLFTDKNYIRNIDNELTERFNMAIAVSNSRNEYIYISSYLNPDEFGNFLNNLAPDEDLVFIHNTIFSIKQYTLKESLGKIYLISDAEKLALRSSMYQKNFFKSKITIMMLSLILIFITAISILSFLISRSILKPLTLLTKASEEIANGNLEYSVNYKSTNEFGKVFSSFDNMRTNLKFSLELQKQYENNRKELLANISHDLQTPITSIMCHIEGIIDNIADTPEKVIKYAQIANSQAHYMSSLIEDLFMLSKLDLKKIPFEFNKLDLIDFFEDCVEEIEDEFKTRNINLNLYYDDSHSYYVMADNYKLKRAVLNILNNSKNYMDKPEGFIYIKIDIIDNYFCITIEDNGKGIAQEDLELIFNPFYRSDKSRNNLIRGSGLGLAITKLIILEHDGSIKAESTLGVGTNFTIKLKRML